MRRIRVEIVNGATRAVLLGSLLLACVSPCMRAQTVSGTVREVGTQGNLEGVRVRLLDMKDSVIASTASSRTGTFRFKLPAPGSYSLQLRQIGFEEMLTTPFALEAADELKIDLEMIRTAVVLDTVAVSANPANHLTRGRAQFMDHYREGRGVFLSGLEIAASKKGIAEFVSTLPGFLDYTGGKATDRSSTACQSLNEELKGNTASFFGAKRSARAEFDRVDDLCALRDDAGRVVYPVDAPCVTSQVDRIGLVKRIHGTDLVVHRLPHSFRMEAMLGAPPDTVTPTEITIHLADIIAVEFYQKPTDIPDKLRLRGDSPEQQFLTSNCAHIQFWTRTAW
jgi:hypothetical protein